MLRTFAKAYCGRLSFLPLDGEDGVRANGTVGASYLERPNWGPRSPESAHGEGNREERTLQIHVVDGECGEEGTL